MMRVHLEGMGITGSLLALCLERAGVDFTWDDANSPLAAWQASTGAVYPTGRTGSIDRWTYERWVEWVRSDRFASTYPYSWLESCAYWFNHKAPPHEGPGQVTREVGGWMRGTEHAAIQINAQRLVPIVRDRFKEKRRESRDTKRLRIVAHGFSARRTHCYWGWTRLVGLDIASSVKALSLGRRASIYFRDGRFNMAYAYPVPGDASRWYAGSSLIKQLRGGERSLEIEPKYERWKQTLERVSGGLLRVVAEGDMLEGWRPASEDVPTGTEPVRPHLYDAADQMRPWVKLMTLSESLVVPPLWNSGIRHFPLVWAQIARALNVSKEDWS